MTSVFWQVIIGLGVFLYGMSRLEAGIQALSGARLKHWLANSTNTPLSSASSGAAVTAILQSSSMVSLLVLAFASAGVIPLYNAIGVILGANLGTTITGWIVATLGFKLKLSAIALPLAGVGGFITVLASSERRIHHWGQLALGLGFLLFGLSLMKEAVDGLRDSWDIGKLQGHHPLVYLLAGTLASAIIRSSSATIMMVLAALNAGQIDLTAAAALVIGADLGTTSTTLLGSIGGPGIKRQLALAHIVFNLIVDLAAFVVVLPFLPELVALAGIDDPLYALVAFHSSINLVGVLMFLPWLRNYTSWIGSLSQPRLNQLQQLAAIKHQVPEAALAALYKHTQQLWLTAADRCLSYFPVSLYPLAEQQNLGEQINGVYPQKNRSELASYEEIKTREVDALNLAIQLQQQPLSEEQTKMLATLVEITRNIVYYSKSLRDVAHNLRDIRAAALSNPQSNINQLYKAQQQFQADLYRRLLPIMLTEQPGELTSELLAQLRIDNNRHYEQINRALYHDTAIRGGAILSLPSLLNLNREVQHADNILLNTVESWQALHP